MDLPYPHRYPNLVIEMQKIHLTTYDLLKATGDSPEEALDIIDKKKEPSTLSLLKIKNTYFPNKPLSYLFRNGAIIISFATVHSNSVKNYIKGEIKSHMEDIIA